MRCALWACFKAFAGAASAVRLARSMEEITAVPAAFILVMPLKCSDPKCDMFRMVWGQAEEHMPGIAWLADCDRAESKAVCQSFGAQFAVLEWSTADGLKPYTGPRKTEHLVAAMRNAYEQAGGSTAFAFTNPASGGGISGGDEAAAFAALADKTDPTDGIAIARVSSAGIHHVNPEVQEMAARLLERALLEGEGRLRGLTDEEQGQALYQLFVHFWKAHDYARAQPALLAAVRTGGNDCWRMQLATMLAPYPASESASSQMFASYRAGMEALLEQPAIRLDLDQTYNFCLFSLFEHSFFYEADFRLHADLFFRVATKAYPALLRAPRAADSARAAPAGAARWCGARLRVGIASACFTSAAHPVPSDFGGVLDRLPRDTFELVFIYFDHANLQPLSPEFLVQRNVRDFVRIVSEGDDWLERGRSQIARLGLDILLFLDLTMSELAHQTAMVRLAPVQVVSHGHPVSSGIGRGAMDYFISWAAAELPTAQEHYTEQLALLPAHTMHQYYESRLLPSGASAVDGLPFRHLTRAAFAGVPAGAHWYLCMQKPHKLSPAFDSMLAGVLVADPQGVIVLHEVQFKGSGPVSKHNKRIYTERLRQAGVDLTRVHFMPAQPHHRLMALYSLSDVVLDSYHAGGCTTTREALEVGALVVTLPAQYLGSRWSLAYYTLMGCTDLVASDKQHYIELAVRMATDRSAASAARRCILDRVHRLFRQEGAVREWAALLRRISEPARRHCAPEAEAPMYALAAEL